MIVGGEWWVYSTEACYLAVLLLSFEKLYRQNSWYLFPPAIAFFSILNPFRLYFVGVFLFIYFLFRHFSSEDPSFKKLFTVGLKMVIFGFLGIIISSLIFIANCQMLIESPRVSGNLALFKTFFSIPVFSLERPDYYLTALLRFFSSDLIGNGRTYTGWHNYFEAPMFYIGLLPLLLMPQVFLFSTRRNKIVYFVFFLIIIIPAIFPFFRYALFLFSGDYYRTFSLFVSLFFLFFCLYALNELDTRKYINVYVLIGTLIVLIIILYFPLPNIITNINDGSTFDFQYPQGAMLINKYIRTAISIFLILYMILILLFKYSSIKVTPFLRIILILVISVEICYMNSEVLNNRLALSSIQMNQKFDYNDYSKDAVDYINAIDKEFFRINKSFRHGPTGSIPFNDAKVQGYYGTPSYDTFSQKYYIRFLEEMNIIKKGDVTSGLYSIGLMYRPLLWSIASIKYHISSYNLFKNEMLNGYDLIATNGYINIYKNNHFLPLGFTYTQFISFNQFRDLSPLLKDQILQKAFVVDEPIDNELKRKLKELQLNDVSEYYSSDSYFYDIDLLKKDTLNITHFSQNSINGTIKLNTPKLLFFSIPYDKGWNAIIDNKKVKPLLCNIGFTGFLLEPGNHSIKLIYKPPYFTVSLILSIIGLLVYIGLIIVDLLVLNRRSMIKS